MRRRSEFGTSFFVAALPRLDERLTPAISQRRDVAQGPLTLLQQRFSFLDWVRSPVGPAAPS